jgi:hypothetical protein
MLILAYHSCWEVSQSGRSVTFRNIYHRVVVVRCFVLQCRLLQCLAGCGGVVPFLVVVIRGDASLCLEVPIRWYRSTVGVAATCLCYEVSSELWFLYELWMALVEYVPLPC